MSYEQKFKALIQMVDDKLKRVLPPEDHPPVTLHEAMHYAVFGGGKRFRPIMTLASAEACGGTLESALIPAVSIELIHSYSLVHDDLPALDNDDLRRGKPTVHKRFGEAIGILAGDALLTQAFQVLSELKPSEKPLEILTEISTAAGTYGMIGGQVSDLQSLGQELDLPLLDHINVHKTGKLIRASAVCGALVAGGDRDSYERMLRYGELIGLAFQSVDDLHDGDGYLKIMKPREVRENIRDLLARAKKEVKVFGSRADKLMALADDLLERMPKENSQHA